MILRAALAACFLCAAAAHGHASGEAAMQHAREGVGSLLRGKYEEAVAAYTGALEAGGLQDVRRANIYNDRGVANWRLKRTRAAIADFNRAIELLPEYAVFYNNRGNALMDLNRAEEALEDFERAIALAPAYGAAYSNRGNALYALGRFEEALGAYSRAIERMATNAVPFNGRGKAQTGLKRPYAALRDYSRAIALNPRYGSAYANRGRVFAELGRQGDAVSDFTQALADDSERPDLYLARARAHAADGKPAPAIQDLTRAIAAAPDLVDAYVERGALYARTKELARAHADLSQALEARRDDAAAYATRASVALRMDMEEEALADVAQALQIDPDSALALQVRGEVHERLEQTERAIADYRAALARDPDLADARAALVRLSGEAPPVEVQVVQSVVSGWTITRDGEGRHVAANPDHPKVRVRLEMYGPGEPRILDWEQRGGAFRGIGLLRYAAGVALDRDGATYEKVAIVDLIRAVVLAIEPYSVGDVTADWEWRETSLVVTDAQGVASEVPLRRVAAATPRQPTGRAAPTARRDGHWFYDSGRGAGSARRQPPRRTSRPSSPSDGGFFDWLLGR